MLRRGVVLEYRTTRSETTDRYYTCAYCGAKAEVSFRAEGDSGWHRDRLLSDDAEERAAAAAEEDMMSDAERVLHLIRCPTCGRRHPGYVRWAYLRVLGWFVLAAGVLSFGAELALGAVVFGIGGIWQGWRERRRFLRADAAQLLRLQPGRLPKPEPKKLPAPKPKVLPPPPELPTARAITAPELPVAPVEPRGPDEEPAFLHDKK